MLRALPPDAAALLATQHGVVTASQLLASGMTPRQCRVAIDRGLLFRPYRGVYVDPEAWHAASGEVRHAMRLLAAQLVAPDAVGVEASAAIARRLPVRAVPERAQVARQPQAGRLVGAHVHRAAVPSADVTSVDGLTVTTTAVTCAAIASGHDFAGALITVDAALRRGLGSDELLAAVERLPYATRRARADRVIDLADPWSESWLESLSRGEQIAAGVPAPLCNVTLIADGREARVDHLWAEECVIGEADGKGKYEKQGDPAEAHWNEKRRQEWLEDLGFIVVRWATRDVADNPAPMLARLARARSRRSVFGGGWPSGVRAELRALIGVRQPARVVAEVRRLQAVGIPIDFAPPDAWRRREEPGSLWTPAAPPKLMRSRRPAA
ncbi:MAG TPA: type IV toxin-antitoxin system AbiEi family antitoxin domain-containing protein [Actinomycetes bacterium]|nr:type IV toxin-antitoxin system AbiEi family antitoxin domain-containing protein [Actinomycetes bacterium]